MARGDVARFQSIAAKGDGLFTRQLLRRRTLVLAMSTCMSAGSSFSLTLRTRLSLLGEMAQFALPPVGVSAARTRPVERGPCRQSD